MSQVKIEVSSQLRTIIQDLERITAAAKNVDKGLADGGKEVSDSIEKNTNRVERFLNEVRSLGGRVAEQLKGDFKALFALNATAGALKLSNQFVGTIKESVTLSDTIRKLGQTFGIAASNFASFQGKVTKGLGDIGLSSDVATQAMGGLVDTPVRGEEALIKYSQTAGQLASITRQQGQEGAIAKGIANVLLARGGNPNDLGQVSKVAEDLRRVFNVTGKAPTETLSAMRDLFEAMPPDFRKNISTRGLANLAAAGQVGGPGSTKFIEELLGRSPIARKALQAQGFGNVFSDQGLDIEKFRKASKAILSRIGFDPTQAAKTLGISDDAAKGFVRLAESLDKVKAAQEGIARQTGDVSEQYRKNMGFGEAFRANLNKVKGFLGGPLGAATQGITDVLSRTSKSTLGAGLVVGGGGILAALLAGGGLRGLGGALIKGAAAKELTGKEVQPVYVVNAAEIGVGGVAAGAIGTLGKIGLAGATVAGAAAGGFALYEGQKKLVENSKAAKSIDDSVQGFANKLYQFFNPTVKAKAQEVHVRVNKSELKVVKPVSGESTY